jgi:hypothetical protein
MPARHSTVAWYLSWEWAWLVEELVVVELVADGTDAILVDYQDYH